jgi:hypothetical protein
MNVECPADISGAVLSALQDALRPEHNCITIAVKMPSRQAIGQLSNVLHQTCGNGKNMLKHLARSTRIVWHLSDGTVQEAGMEDRLARPHQQFRTVFSRYTHHNLARVPVAVRMKRVKGFHASLLPTMQIAATTRQATDPATKAAAAAETQKPKNSSAQSRNSSILYNEILTKKHDSRAMRPECNIQTSLGRNCLPSSSAPATISVVSQYFVQFDAFLVCSTGVTIELSVSTPLCPSLAEAEQALDFATGQQECMLVLKKVQTASDQTKQQQTKAPAEGKTRQLFVDAVNALNHFLKLFHKRLRPRIVPANRS